MLAILLQVVAVAAGWSIVRQLPMEMRRLEAAAASVAVGFAVTPWVYFVLVLAFGWRVALPVGSIMLVLGTALAWWRLKPRLKLTSADYGPSMWWRVVGTASGIMTALVLACLVVLSYNNPAPDGSWWANGNVWGDLPVHTSFITQFAHGDRLDLVSPLYKRIPLTYPLMADLWSGVLMRVTDSWRIGLMLPSMLIILSLLELLFTFAWRALGSARAAWMSWMMIVYSGAFHAAVVLGQVLLTQGWDAYNAKVGTSFPMATGDNYLNFFYSHPLPQRAYAFGMPLLIVILSALLELYRRRKQTGDGAARDRRRLALLAGVLAGLLPLVHTHSFLVLAGLVVLGLVGWWWREGRVVRELAWFAVPAVVLAIPQVWYQFRSSYHGGFSYWIAGWMMRDFVAVQDNWLWFWLMELGWLFVVILAGWWWLRRQRAAAEVWWLYGAGVAIFAICNVYVFQPTEWDNMKFFEYAFWFVMMAAGAIMARWWRSWPGKVAVVLLMASMCAPGVMSLVLSGPRITFQLVSAADVKFGQKMRTVLPDDAYMLVTDRHNNPLLMFADRKMLMCFSGWYVNYGSDWPQTMTDRKTMLEGGEGAAELIRQYGVNFAAFTDQDVADGTVNLSFFEQHYPVFAREGEWWVFGLK